MDPSLKSKKNAFYTRKVIWFQPVLIAHTINLNAMTHFCDHLYDGYFNLQ
jgi:hypothetical protein